MVRASRQLRSGHATTKGFAERIFRHVNRQLSAGWPRHTYEMATELTLQRVNAIVASEEPIVEAEGEWQAFGESR